MQDAGWTVAGSGTQNPTATSGLIAVCAIALALAMPVAMGAEAPASNTVRLYSAAVVTSNQVTLRDIAEVSGEGTQLAATWVLTEAPKPGQETTLEQDAIQKAMIRRGINPSRWLFRGSARCRVSRPALSRSAGELETEVREAQQPESFAPRSKRQERKVTATAPATDLVAPAPDEPDPNTLGGALHQHVMQRLGRIAGRPCIQVSPAFTKLLTLSRPNYEFRITDRSERTLGLVPLEISIYREGRLEQVQSILAQVNLVKSVVIATGPINRGQSISSADVCLRERSFERTDELGIDNLAAVVGQRAVRLIGRDEMLSGKDMEPVPLILRNDLVTVTTRIGNVTVSSSAKAMAPASYGQSIELRNEASKQTFLGVVTGPKTAELVAGASMPPATVSMAGGKH